MNQPEIRRYIHWLHHNDNFGMTANRYDDQSRELLDELFVLLEKVKSVTDNGVRSLWLTAQRGMFDDFGNIAEMIEEGEFDSLSEAEEYWKEMYPDEIEWYAFSALEDKEIGYRAIYLCHRCAIVQDKRRNQASLEQDISEFVQWLLESVRNCIDMLRLGNYNDYVLNNLPPQHRTGTIKRKDFWSIWSDKKREFFKRITPEDVEEFIRIASKQPKTVANFSLRLRSMTANDFYKYCTMGYEANNYRGNEKQPKEQYYMNADGRDDGLCEIAPDSPEEFSNWLNNRAQYGGHPWEICRGGNSTHISLMVVQDEKGFYLFLSGSAINRTIETVKIYLALSRAGVPVYLCEATTLVSRLEENELIGIVPEGINPFYCESLFSQEHIITFINLPEEDRESFLPYCNWQPIQPIYLV